MMRYLVSPVIAISVLMLLGAGCGKSEPNQPSAEQPEEKKGIFTSIKDAFNQSTALRCEYMDEEGSSVTTYIKNKKIFLEQEIGEADESGMKVQKVKGVIMDDKMYMWSDASNKGMLIDFAKATGEDVPKMGDKEIHSTEDVISKLEEKKERCQMTTIDDSKFELPEGVEFLEF